MSASDDRPSASDGAPSVNERLSQPILPAISGASLNDCGALTNCLEVRIPFGTRCMVLGPLLLGERSTEVSTAATEEVAQVLDHWEGAGVLVLCGDQLDATGKTLEQTIAPLKAYSRICQALLKFSQQPGRRLLWLPGLRDSRLAWDEQARLEATALTGAEFVLSVDLLLETALGARKVRVEPGHNLDPRSFGAGDPSETPLAHHLLAEVLPEIAPAQKGWLEGLDRLPNQSMVPRFLLSRLLYRKVAPYAWWFLLPVLIALMFKLPLAYLIPVVGRRAHNSVWPMRFGVVALTSVLDLLLIALGIALMSRRTWAAVSGLGSNEMSEDENMRARAQASSLIHSGHCGLIVAHTLSPELKALGDGFFGNCGAAAAVVTELPGRLGLPSAFVVQRHVSWIELEAGSELHVRLLRSVREGAQRGFTERLLAKRPESPPSAGQVVASFPHGPWWPKGVPKTIQDRKVRRITSSVIALVGLLDLLSAVTPPLRAKLDPLFDLVPFAVFQAAVALVALSGLALLALAGGIRRGQRQAWAISVALLGGVAVLQIVKRGDLPEAVVAIAAMLMLLRHQKAFGAATDRLSVRRGLWGLAAGAGAATVLGVVGVELDLTVVRLHYHHHLTIALPTLFAGIVERLVGLTVIPIPGRIDAFITPSMLAVGFGLAVWALYLAFRPVVDRRVGGNFRTRAREIVGTHGGGTLDYFALRDDKSYFFFGSSLVAYANWKGVCLVSPDPIGPATEREECWSAFRKMIDRQGLILGVLGAREEWLPIYRASGMQDLYVGDEAVVLVDNFTLEGGKRKALRQAVNRIARNGYTLTFHDPSNAPVQLASELKALMGHSRQGEAERGFSMTLGRIFDKRDVGLLLAVAHAPDGKAVAFCQYVPAPAINGYSLDLMRRDGGEHPNGLMDFIIVGTIGYLRQQGNDGLGLNFATMRAVLAGEADNSLSHRVERWLLKRMSGSMQIESLWRFNAKYDPQWLSRYAVFDSPEHALPVAMAIARAESFWELPLIGRFLSNSESKKETVSAAP